MKGLKKIFKDKKGVALVNAVVFMVVVFSLCALLTSLTLFGHLNNTLSERLFENELALQQIGEDFVAGELKKEEYENYDCAVDGNTLTVYSKSDTEKKTILLRVTVDDNGKITKWSTSPTP